MQPGQSKTVAYKQVSYHYNKDLDGKPMGRCNSLLILNQTIANDILKDFQNCNCNLQKLQSYKILNPTKIRVKKGKILNIEYFAKMH